MELLKDYWSRWTATLRYGGHAFNLKLYDLGYYFIFLFLIIFLFTCCLFSPPPLPPAFPSLFHLLFLLLCQLIFLPFLHVLYALYILSLFYTLFFCPSLSPPSLQEWLRYQSLWDMEFSNITAKVGDDLVLWQRLLQDIK